ncbi:Homoserine [Podosphaera aphanis]|nr:Homoserine [Podosphaera aphanis]
MDLSSSNVNSQPDGLHQPSLAATNDAEEISPQLKASESQIPTSKSWKYRRIFQQPENPFSKLVPDQTIAIIPSFTLESGITLLNVPLAYTTKGKLSPGRDNAMVVCHALTGSSIVSDWWGLLLGGSGRAFDTSRFFVICINSLGSPYGSASPVTCKDGNPENEIYGPEFPLTTIRDDVNIQKMLLDDLGVKKVAAVIGGSMGGMLVLEWAYFGKDYVRCIVPIATSSRHSAWGISWGEAQRQSIYADPKYKDGYYDLSDPPISGLGAARMSALLTYRSRNSFESRFGRNIPENTKNQSEFNGKLSPSSPGEIHLAIHNDGHHSNRNTSTSTDPQFQSMVFAGSDDSLAEINGPVSTYFSAQSYLRYQGNKFVKRFDANCYISLSRKLDTHDVSRSRAPSISEALALIQQPTLVLGIESDGLFTFSEQVELASGIPNAKLEKIESPEGHDAFLLQFGQVNDHILKFLKETLKDIMETEPEIPREEGIPEHVSHKNLCAEAEEDDITVW